MNFLVGVVFGLLCILVIFQLYMIMKLAGRQYTQFKTQYEQDREQKAVLFAELIFALKNDASLMHQSVQGSVESAADEGNEHVTGSYDET